MGLEVVKKDTSSTFTPHAQGFISSVKSFLLSAG